MTDFPPKWINEKYPEGIPPEKLEQAQKAIAEFFVAVSKATLELFKLVEPLEDFAENQGLHTGGIVGPRRTPLIGERPPEMVMPQPTPNQAENDEK